MAVIPPSPEQTAPAATPRPAPPAVKQFVVLASPAAQARAPGFLARNRTVVLFALFLVAADLGVGLLAPVWDRHSPDDYAARVEGCARQPRDVVFVGGSPVTEGIDPAVAAGALWRGRPLADGYAIGLHGGTTTDFYYATKRACPTPPRVLVYGITASDLNDARNEPHGTRELLSPRDAVEVARTRPDAASWVLRHYAHSQFGKLSSLYRHRHGIRMAAALQADAIMPGCAPEAVREATELREHAADLATGRGYAPLKGYTLTRYDQLKAAGVPPPPFRYLDRFRTGSHLKYLHKLAHWCAEQGTDLVLVDMPVTADLEARYAEEFAEYRARLAEVARERGLAVIRGARTGAGLTDEHFADLIHLRQEGCRKFSAWLRGRLEEVGRGEGSRSTPHPP